MNGNTTCVYYPIRISRNARQQNSIGYLVGKTVTAICPYVFSQAKKAGLFLTNPSSKLKLHSNEIPVFGENGFEVTAFHVVHDPNNAWAISGIRADDPFLCNHLLNGHLPFVGHPREGTDQSILDEDLAFETARKTCLVNFYDVHVPTGHSRASS